jgi:hypothetical protein
LFEDIILLLFLIFAVAAEIVNFLTHLLAHDVSHFKHMLPICLELSHILPLFHFLRDKTSRAVDHLNLSGCRLRSVWLRFQLQSQLIQLVEAISGFLVGLVGARRPQDVVLSVNENVEARKDIFGVEDALDLESSLRR